jgi:hypothetical protein
MTNEFNDMKNGVVCLYCSAKMPLSAPMKRAMAAVGGSGFIHRVSIVRCTKCGKEASYLPSEIVNLDAIQIAS